MQKKVKQIKESSPQQVHKNLMNIFSDRANWPLHSGKYHRLKCPIFFKYTKSLEGPNSLSLYNNKQSDIVKQISVTGFPNLLKIDLKNNRIESIEHFTRFSAPELEEINFSDNHITRVISGFNKASKKLKSLKFYANNIVDMNNAVWQLNLDPDTSLQLILGINYITDFKWINRVKNSRMIQLSIENNRCGTLITSKQIRYWNVDNSLVLM